MQFFSFFFLCSADQVPSLSHIRSLCCCSWLELLRWSVRGGIRVLVLCLLRVRIAVFLFYLPPAPCYLEVAFSFMTRNPHSLAFADLESTLDRALGVCSVRTPRSGVAGQPVEEPPSKSPVPVPVQDDWWLHDDEPAHVLTSPATEAGRALATVSSALSTVQSALRRTQPVSAPSSLMLAVRNAAAASAERAVASAERAASCRSELRKMRAAASLESAGELAALDCRLLPLLLAERVFIPRREDLVSEAVHHRAVPVAPPDRSSSETGPAFYISARGASPDSPSSSSRTGGASHDFRSSRAVPTVLRTALHRRSQRAAGWESDSD